jgi:hypothetical protein
MTTTFPVTVDSYSLKVDTVTDVLAADINNPQDAIVAIENALYQGLDNLFINGGFDVWQRTTNDTAVTTTRKYVADRWGFVTGASTLANVQRSTTVRTGARSKYSCELVGAASVTTVNISQRIESLLSGRYKRTLYFSGYIYNGSGASFTPKIYVSTPSAADNWTTSTVRNGSGSGESLQACTDATWTLVSWTADVSGYTDINNGLEIRIEIPSGSLVASDTVRLAEFMLATLVETLFVQPNFKQELAKCKRYYDKSYNYSVAPGTASGVGARSFQTRRAIAASTAGSQFYSEVFSVLMRTAPTIVLYDITAGTANAITVVASVRSGCTANDVGEVKFRFISVDNTSATAIVADDVVSWHFTASAEL